MRLFKQSGSLFVSKKMYLVYINIFFSFLVAFAGHEVENARLNGTGLVLSAPISVQDNRFPNLVSSAYTSYASEDKVILGINTSSSFIPASTFDYTFNVKIDYVDVNLTASSFTVNITLGYDNTNCNSYNDKSVYRFTGAYQLTATLLTITNNANGQPVTVPPANMYLDVEIDAERYYTFDALTAPAIGTIINAYDAVNDELEISWNKIPGAEDYDLEWTFVNDYGTTVAGAKIAASALYYDFRNNASRITTSNQYYRVPKTFESGYLLYRIRGVGRGGAAFDKKINGTWSVADGSRLVNTFANYYQVTSAHDDSKNWIYNANFAEEGKKKTNVSYFDGTLRNRQDVSKINSDNQAIVGETIYDYQGRGAVSVLPTPAFSPILKYYPGFNLPSGATGTTSYRNIDFDTDPTSCVTSIKSMLNTTGASKYYSVNNPDKVAQQSFVPDAQLYPFSVTEFEPDNTGRIRRKSGVGPDHKLESTHETKYFYSQPAQEQIDRLFGSDVGYKSHYKRNSVIDPNGQVSVSYLDVQGRVIATSLAGNNPTATDPVPDIATQANLTVDMLNKINTTDTDTPYDDNKLSDQGSSLIFSTDIAVEVTGLVSFSYSVTAASFNTATRACMPGTVCYDCIYDLEVSVKDQCGVDAITPVTQTVGHINPYDVTCDGSAATFQFTPNPITVTLNAGTYTVYKKLKINEAAYNYYLNDYITQGTCVSTEQSFINTAVAQVDTSGCNLSCAACVTSLGSEATYIAKTGKDHNGYILAIQLCNKPCKYLSACEASYNEMIADVSPGGQYAQYLYNGTIDPAKFPLSVLNTSNSFPAKYSPALPNWKTPKTEAGLLYYYEDDGITRSYVAVTPDVNNPGPNNFIPQIDVAGVTQATTTGQVDPQYLTNVQDFVSKWKPSWAKSLVAFHPEYCYFSWCDQNKNKPSGSTYSSNGFDSLMLATTSYTVALANGSLNIFPNACTNPNDPYFMTGGLGAGAQCTAMNALLQNYPTSSSTFSMWEFADLSVNCGTTYGTTTDLQNCLATNNPQTHTSKYQYINTDSEWEKFKYLYLAAKQQLQQNAADASALSGSCYNGCIGTQSFSSTSSGMSSAQFTSSNQPCSSGTYKLYSNKIKRFQNASDVMGSVSNTQATVDKLKNKVDYELWIQTGQCPKARDLQYFLSKLASSNNLATTVPLINYQEFTLALYKDLTASSSYVSYSWTPVKNGTTLNATFPGSSLCTLGVNLTFTSTYSWANYPGSFKITGFKQLTYTSGTNFTIVADVDNDNNPATPTVEAALTGTTCFNIGSCSTDFAQTINQECIPTQSDLDMLNLWNTLITNAAFSSSAINLESATYSPYFTEQLKPYTGSTTTNWAWQTSGNTRTINSTGSSNTLVITFSSLPGTYTSFANFTPTGSGGFTVIPYNGTTALTQISGTITLNRTGYTFPVGNCASPSLCSDAKYKTGKDLTALLNNLTSATPPPAFLSTTTLTYNPLLTPLLKSYIGGSVSAGYTWGNVSSTDPTLSASLLSGANNMCQVNLTFIDATDATYKMSTITGFSDLYADETNLTNGISYSFTIRAWFGANGSKLLKGTSCFPLFNCHECSVADAVNIVNNSDFKSACVQPPVEFSSESFTCNSPGNNTAYSTVGNSTTGWLIIGSYPITDHTGNSSNFLFGKSLYTTGNKAWFKQVAVVAGTTYQFSAWVQLINGYNSLGTYTPISLKVNTVPYTTAIVIANSVSTINGWQYVSGTGYATSTGTIELQIIVPGNDNTCFAIDDITFIKQGCVPLSSVTPPISPTSTYVNPCVQHQLDIATQNGKDNYQKYLYDVKTSFRADYVKKCIGSAVETFTRTFPDMEYHYTLYYYDQAGNLIRTVPPKGVVLVAPASWPQVKTDRISLNTNSAYNKVIYTNHTFATTYKYNTLNQLVQQTTPDAGVSKFWYDKLGRIVASQNAKQYAITSPGYAHSYTIYDALGRITKVGEFYSATYNFGNSTGNIINPLINAVNYPDNICIAGVTGKSQITSTTYDDDPDYPGQLNMRGRVASIKLDDNNDGVYEYETHYSYDTHGNVNKLIQRSPALGAMVINYTYDLVSGNVTQVIYNQSQNDEFRHKYEYDSDNRLSNVYTSANGVVWDQDAKYYYYKHGPQARIELGNDKVQGLDYAYTLQGWIKGVNANTFDDVTRDQGKDGSNSNANLNGLVARDEYGYSLGYYNTATGDYKAINTSANFIASIASSGLDGGSPNLFNGNIRHMITSVRSLSSAIPQAMAYKYDQLQRITRATMYNNISNNVWAAGGASTSYTETYAYDPNGNINTLTRTGNGGVAMDNFTYNYFASTNKLQYVADPTPSGNFTTDIDGQGTTNYDYDQIGNLKQDIQEQITATATTGITWNVYGKIKKITHDAGSTKPDLEFVYDGSGNRTKKIAKPRTGGVASTQGAWTNTCYVRDATGNIMAVYEQTYSGVTSSQFTVNTNLKETDLYGSGRLGLIPNNTLIVSQTNTFSGYNADGTFNNVANGIPTYPPPPGWITKHSVGQKQFELANHLGNVLASVSDRRTAQTTLVVVNNLFNTTLEGWTPTSGASTVTWNSASGGRMQISTSTQWEGALLLSVATTPGESYTYTADVNMGTGTTGVGLEAWNAGFTQQLNGLWVSTTSTNSFTFTATTTTSNLKVFNGTNNGTAVTFYIDNVNVSKVGYYTACVVNAQDYYPYGMLMPGRSPISSIGYRFGFNGMEKDDEFKTNGNSYDFGARIYDPRLGRFLSVDPLSKKYPELSPYQFASNNPIQFVDIDGLEAGDPPNNDGNTKVEKSTAEKVLGIVTKGVEHLFDNVTFTLTSVPAAVGNTAKSFIKQSNRLGFLKALDIGSGAVLSDKEKFTPYGFSFDSKTKFTQKGNEQHEGTENVVDYDTGKKLIGGTVTLATSGLGTGVKGFIGKIILGKGLDALGKKDTPNNTKSEGGPPTLHKSIDIHVTAEPVLQAPSSGDVPQK
jgi:RHS repeat-associated protein